MNKEPKHKKKKDVEKDKPALVLTLDDIDEFEAPPATLKDSEEESDGFAAMDENY